MAQGTDVKLGQIELWFYKTQEVGVVTRIRGLDIVKEARELTQLELVKE